MHGHLLGDVGGVRRLTIKGPFHDQSLQDPITIGETTRPILDPMRGLHTHMEEEVSEVEVVGWITVPSVTCRSIYTCHHGFGSRVWHWSTVSRVAGTGMGVSSHMRYNLIIVSPWNEVVVTKISRHDDKRWRNMTKRSRTLSRLYPIHLSLIKTP